MKIFTFVCSLLLLLLSSSVYAKADTSNWRLVDNRGTIALKKSFLKEGATGSCMLHEDVIKKKYEKKFIFIVLLLYKETKGTRLSVSTLVSNSDQKKTDARMIWEDECGQIPWTLIKDYFRSEE